MSRMALVWNEEMNILYLVNFSEPTERPEVLFLKYDYAEWFRSTLFMNGLFESSSFMGNKTILDTWEE